MSFPLSSVSLAGLWPVTLANRREPLVTGWCTMQVKRRRKTKSGLSIGFVLFYIDGLATASFITVFLYAAGISRHFTENKLIHKCMDNLKRDWTLSSTAIPLSFGHFNASLFINGSEFDFLQNYLPSASQTNTVISDTWFVTFSKAVITFIEQPRR